MALNGFPSKLKVRHRFVESFVLNPTTSGVAYYNFRANSLQDPDLTGFGHQPMGYDQISPHYDHYTVVGSKMTCYFTPEATADVAPCYFGVILTDTPVTIVNVTELLEQRFTGGVKWLGAINRVPATQTKRKYFSARKFFGVKDIIGQQPWRAATGSNPNEDAYFQVFCASIGLNDPGIFRFTVYIDYIAVYTEPKTMTQS